MGPRFFKRGNALSTRHVRIIHVASMGPRFFKRGNATVYAGVDGGGVELQWGRASSSAETSRVRTRGIAGAGFNGAALLQARKHSWFETREFEYVALQWGRASSSAETLPPPSCVSART